VGARQHKVSALFYKRFPHIHFKEYLFWQLFCFVFAVTKIFVFMDEAINFFPPLMAPELFSAASEFSAARRRKIKSCLCLLCKSQNSSIKRISLNFQKERELSSSFCSLGFVCIYLFFPLGCGLNLFRWPNHKFNFTISGPPLLSDKSRVC